MKLLGYKAPFIHGWTILKILIYFCCSFKKGLLPPCLIICRFGFSCHNFD